MTPFASVAMLENLALLKIALCKASAFSRTSLRWTSVTTSPTPESPPRIAFGSIFVPFLYCDWPCLVFSLAAVGARERQLVVTGSQWCVHKLAGDSQLSLSSPQSVPMVNPQRSEEHTSELQ